MRREKQKAEQLKSYALKSEIEREQLIEQNFNLALRESPKKSPDEFERIRRIRSSSLPPVLYRQQSPEMRPFRRSPRLSKKGRRSVSQSPRTRSPAIGETPPLPPKKTDVTPKKETNEQVKPNEEKPSEEKKE